MMPALKQRLNQIVEKQVKRRRVIREVETVSYREIDDGDNASNKVSQKVWRRNWFGWYTANYSGFLKE